MQAFGLKLSGSSLQTGFSILIQWLHLYLIMAPVSVVAFLVGKGFVGSEGDTKPFISD
jgi:hypothetical protein